MLPFVCSASPSCSSQFPVSFPAGPGKFSLLWRSEAQCIQDVKRFFGSRGGIPRHDMFLKPPHSTGYSHSLIEEAPECPSSVDSSIFSPYPSYFDDIVRGFPKGKSESLPENWNCYTKQVGASFPLETDLNYVGNDLLNENVGINNLKENVGDLLGGIQDSTTASVSSAQKAVEDTYNAIIASLEKTALGGAESINNIINGFLSSFEKSKEQTGDNLVAVSGNFQGSLLEAGGLAANVLRKSISLFESFLSKGSTYVVYSYDSTKSFLPTNLQEEITTVEGKFSLVLTPISTAVQKVYILIEGVEKNLGFDPNDPLVHFIVNFGILATLGVSYWLLLYGGYSGNLSPESTFELLNTEENAVLIDIRPEDLREREGVPDLRRRARFKYASVSLPEVDGSVRKLLSNAAEVNDFLIASIVRNLKIFKDGTKVIVLDARGDRSKGIARSLRKLGVKKTYLVEGGFRSWVQSSLRIKELKPETALDFLNEEAEAIIEEIKPTPLLIFGYGLGAVATVYALLEWEKTLQIVGLIGIAQSVYRRISTYETSEDLRADVSLLLTPVAMGAEVLSRAAGNPDQTKIGLPTSPSSTAVQDRVIQAAAKHESQPSDLNEPQPSTTDGMDLSEA